MVGRTMRSRETSSGRRPHDVCKGVMTRTSEIVSLRVALEEAMRCKLGRGPSKDGR